MRLGPTALLGDGRFAGQVERPGPRGCPADKAHRYVVCGSVHMYNTSFVGVGTGV